MGVAVSIDDQPPQVVNVFTPATYKDEDFLGRQFYENDPTTPVSCTLRRTVNTPGQHTLKITMVDPTVVVMKIIIHDAPLPSSYFGPPESF